MPMASLFIRTKPFLELIAKKPDFSYITVNTPYYKLSIVSIKVRFTYRVICRFIVACMRALGVSSKQKTQRQKTESLSSIKSVFLV